MIPASKKSTARTLSVALVIGIIGLGLGANYIFHQGPTPNSPVTTTTSAQAFNGDQLTGQNEPLSAFMAEASADYVLGSAFGFVSSCTTIQLSNDTLSVPSGSGFGFVQLNGSLYVRSGTIQMCPTSPGRPGISFTFTGDAFSGGAEFTSLVFTYKPQGPAPSTITTVTVYKNATTGLNPTFLKAYPSLLVNYTEAALKSSTNATTQVLTLADSLKSSTDPAIKSTLALFPQGADYAAAYLLNAATTGTAYASSAYAALENEFK